MTNTQRSLDADLEYLADSLTTRFDGYEIHGCMIALVDSQGTAIYEQNDDLTYPDLVSLYGHLPTGGLECLADFPDYPTALEFKASLHSISQLKTHLSPAITPQERKALTLALFSLYDTKEPWDRPDRAKAWAISLKLDADPDRPRKLLPQRDGKPVKP